MPTTSGFTLRLCTTGCGALTTDEKAELAALSKENRVLKLEREILRKTTDFFAKQNA